MNTVYIVSISDLDEGEDLGVVVFANRSAAEVFVSFLADRDCGGSIVAQQVFFGPRAAIGEFLGETVADPEPEFEVFYTVFGRGEFPVDMLRYDGSEVVRGDASSDDPLASGRDVLLRKRTTERDWTPAFPRWESFGWWLRPGITRKPAASRKEIVR